MKPLAIGEVHFDRAFSFQQSNRFASVQALLRTGRPEFAIYHECFERLVCETLIARGQCTTLEALPALPAAEPLSRLRFLVGYNNHSPERVRQANEFFGRYEANEADFIPKKLYLSTEYGQHVLAHAVDSSARRRKLPTWSLELLAKRNVDAKVRRFVNIFRNIKRAERLVGSADKDKPSATLHHYDVPWAIKYGDYYRLRDGAHRRSVYAYLGEPLIPTLVADFDAITAEMLEPFPQYLSEHFKWYKAVIEAAKD
jgi:hypothetical protein